MKKLIDYDSELTNEEIKHTEELARELVDEDVEEFVEFVKEVESEPIPQSIMDKFCWEALEGTDSFKRFVSNYVHEFVKINFETSDLAYFDWLFHQHLRDAFIAYSRSILSSIQNRNREKDLKDITESMTEKYGKDKLKDVTFMDIFHYITDKNGDKNLGKFVKENK